MKICRLCTVSGRVQGVFFRDSTKAEAERLGLQGWVHNESDGSVRLLACGELSAVDQLANWLNVGPSYARVTRVSCEDQAYESLTDFKII